MKNTANHPYSRRRNTFNYPRPNLDEAETDIALRKTANWSLDELLSMLYLHCELSLEQTKASIRTDANGKYYRFNPRHRTQAQNHLRILLDYVEFGLRLKPQLLHGLPFELLMLESSLICDDPFEKFNVELAQLTLIELLLRRGLKVPYLDLRSDLRNLGYLAALRLFRQGQDRRLTQIWERRFLSEGESITVY